MKIRLNEIPEDGRHYDFNRQTAELNEALRDLIQQAPYQVDLSIRPLNSKDYDLSGEVHTETQEQCSICAEDFTFKVDKKLREILIPDMGEDRTGKYAKTSPVLNTEEETGLSVTNYKSSQFDLGEFIHEAIALEVPFNPRCADCQKKKDQAPFVYDEKMSEEIKPSPFQSLKDLKLN